MYKKTAILKQQQATRTEGNFGNEVHFWLSNHALRFNNNHLYREEVRCFLNLNEIKNNTVFKVPMPQNFLSFQVKVHIEKGTSAKKFFDLNKTRFFYEFF